MGIKPFSPRPLIGRILMLGASFGMMSLSFLLIAPVGSAKDTKPNVLMTMVDDLNGEFGGCGSKSAKTPHLDSFATAAVRFTQAYCQAPPCHPSRNNMLSGLRPETKHEEKAQRPPPR